MVAKTVELRALKAALGGVGPGGVLWSLAYGPRQASPVRTRSGLLHSWWKKNCVLYQQNWAIGDPVGCGNRIRVAEPVPQQPLVAAAVVSLVACPSCRPLLYK